MVELLLLYWNPFNYVINRFLFFCTLPLWFFHKPLKVFVIFLKNLLKNVFFIYVLDLKILSLITWVLFNFFQKFVESLKCIIIDFMYFNLYKPRVFIKDTISYILIYTYILTTTGLINLLFYTIIKVFIIVTLFANFYYLLYKLLQKHTYFFNINGISIITQVLLIIIYINYT